MKEGGIIATSFTIYPDLKNGQEDFKGGRGRRERGSCPVGYYFSLRGFISDQTVVILTGNRIILGEKEKSYHKYVEANVRNITAKL